MDKRIIGILVVMTTLDKDDPYSDPEDTVVVDFKNLSEPKDKILIKKTFGYDPIYQAGTIEPVAHRPNGKDAIYLTVERM